MNNTSSDCLMQLERTIHALEGINHGISSAVETESGITPMQICCMIELVNGALTETLAKLNKLLQSNTSHLINNIPSRNQCNEGDMTTR